MNSLQEAMVLVQRENNKLDAFDCAQIAYARKCIELAEAKKQLEKLKLTVN